MQKTAVVIVVVIAIAALGTIGVLQAQKSKEKGPVAETGTEQKATSVTALTITPRDIDERVAVTGTLQPASQVTVGSRYAGRIAWLIGKEGTRVRRGDMVGRLEDMDARTQVRAAQAALSAASARVEQARAALAQQSTATDSGISSAEAALAAANARLEQAKAAAVQQTTSTASSVKTAEANVAAAKARLQQAQASADATEATVKAQVKAAEAAVAAAKSRLAMLRNGARTQEQAQAKNAVELARATYENDKANYDRVKRLFDEKAVSQSVLDNAATRLKISQTQLNSAQEQYALVKEGARKEEIDAAEAAVHQAEEGLATAKANLKQVDVATANVEIARTGLEQAQAALDNAGAAKTADIVMRDKDVLAAQAGVKQAEQALKHARTGPDVNSMRRSDLNAAIAAQQQASEAVTAAMQAWDYTQIFSPVDGVISEKMVEIGESVGGSEPVFKIATEKMLYFEASVSELEATRIRAGQPVRIMVDAMQNNRTNFYSGGQAKPIFGSVEKVVPVVNARTRNFTVRIVVPATAALFPGMFARGEVVVMRHEKAVAVPKEALITKGDRQVIFTVVKDTAREKVVAVGASDGTYVQVISGLAAGAKVVTVGQQTLADGDPVKVVNENGK
ncbi:MAG: efflux RND transporter periplasmic adaptor subunit [Armatimonadota bacterium]